jgi:hypothetical protein
MWAWFLPFFTAALMAVSTTCSATIGLLSAVGLVWGYNVVGDSVQFSALVTEWPTRASSAPR